MKLGLAMAGGGARGSALIGALMELDALGIKPDLIAGTSIGGIIGSMYAAGMTPEQLAEIMRGINPSQLYGLPRDDSSITSNEKVAALIQKSFTDHFGEDYFADRPNPRPRFNDLQIPMAVIATDLISRQEVVMDEGDLVRALLATSCVPVLFPPVKYADRYLVDGFLVNNIPLDVVRSRGALFTVAIDLTSSSPYSMEKEEETASRAFNIDWSEFIDGRIFDRFLYQSTRGQLWRVVTSVMDVISTGNARLTVHINPPDLLIEPYLGTIGLLDFHRVDEGIEAGRKAVRRAAPDVEKLLTRMAKLREAELEPETD
ncbi:MAG: patatin-like phospholipase family protein [Chloroflexota bacterium]